MRVCVFFSSFLPSWFRNLAVVNESTTSQSHQLYEKIQSYVVDIEIAKHNVSTHNVTNATNCNGTRNWLLRVIIQTLFVLCDDAIMCIMDVVICCGCLKNYHVCCYVNMTNARTANSSRKTIGLRFMLCSFVIFNWVPVPP